MYRPLISNRLSFEVVSALIALRFPPNPPKGLMLHDSMPPHSPRNFPRHELPQVDIRAVAFHRWRTLKWLVSFVEPHSGCPREGRARTFDAAVQLARTWSLAYRAEQYGSSALAADLPSIDLDPWDVHKDLPTIQ